MPDDAEERSPAAQAEPQPSTASRIHDVAELPEPVGCSKSRDAAATAYRVLATVCVWMVGMETALAAMPTAYVVICSPRLRRALKVTSCAVQ